MAKKKILLLSDDLRMHSGIATMSREIVLGTCHQYDWVQLGAAIKHPEQGKCVDVSEHIRKESGVKDANVRIYANSGYGNEDLLRQLLTIEKPDAILHYTDPRFWGWLYNMEHEIRQNIPIMYYTIWDDMPFPRWNKPFYDSCDLLMAISKQSYSIVNHVTENKLKDWQTTYVPHGIDEKIFRTITELDPNYKEFKKWKNDFLEGRNPNFILFYNNRNIRRKMMGDVLLSFKHFCDGLPKKEADKCLLLMHTHIVDENGTDLAAVAREMIPEYNVLFSDKKINSHQMNYLYNIADVTINLASNEGFGLGTCESLMSGTPIIVNVTGGLQDQCGFKLKDKWLSENDYRDNIHSLHNDKKWADNPDLTWGEWVKPVWPRTRSLQGSPPTPYIFDDRCRWDEAGDRVKEWYDVGSEERERCGELGREFTLKEEIGMSGKNMCARFVKDMNTCMEKFEPRARYTLYDTEIDVREENTFTNIIP